MSTMNFNLRGVDSHVMVMLKQTAAKKHTSINSLILMCIEQGLGYTHKINRQVYHDLDALAGSWDENDVKEFNANTVYFEKVDQDLWP